MRFEFLFQCLMGVVFLTSLPLLNGSSLNASSLSVPTSEQIASVDRFGVDDIRPTVHELLEGRVSSGNITSEALKKTCVQFIERVDPQKVYFLSKEIDDLLSSSFIQSAINQYRQGRFDFFLRVLNVTENAVSRARAWRNSFINDKESIGRVQRLAQKIAPFKEFASDLQNLQDRQLDWFCNMIREALPQKFDANLWKKGQLYVERAIEESENEFLLSSCLNMDDREELFARLFLKSFAATLDAHTTVFSPQEAQRLRFNLDKEFEGTGILLKDSPEGYVVESIYKGSPADRSKVVRAGDLVIMVNGSSVSTLALPKVQEIFNSPSGSSLEITFARKEGKEGLKNYRTRLISERFEISEGRASSKSLPFQNGVILYIDLPSFYGGEGEISCADDVARLLSEAKKKSSVLGLILDLRLNRGGYLQEAVKVAGLFIKTGVIVQAQYFDGRVKAFRDIDPNIFYSGPMVVLVSKSTASAAEIVAEALKEYGVGVVVGDEHTFGKGSIQYQTASQNGFQQTTKGDSGFKVTVGRYYSPMGGSTQLKGVQSDIVVMSPYAYEPIGEAYLKGALSSDSVSPMNKDLLEDISRDQRAWYTQNYLPYVQLPVRINEETLDTLRDNSQNRVRKNARYCALLNKMKNSEIDSDEKLQVMNLELDEAYSIVKDMILLNRDRPFVTSGTE